MKTVKDIKLKNKTVLLRADYNVLDKDGNITGNYRITQGIPTLDYLKSQGCKIVIVSHVGRPGGKPDPRLSMEPIAKRLAKILDRRVVFVPNCIGDSVRSAIERMQAGDIILLENLRFYPGEEANDEAFAQQLANLADVFVQDGFGVVHRAHASTSAITKLLPSVAGLLLEKEVANITAAMEKPARPLVAIVGGAKVSDKIEFLQKLAEKADKVMIGGAMANTFFKAQGTSIGKSVFEDGQMENVKSFDKYKQKMVLPKQVATADVLAAKASRQDKAIGAVVEDDYILDNDFSTNFKDIAKAKTVIWNGQVGMTEYNNFKSGSLGIAKAIIDSGATSVVGGGDTAAFIENEDLAGKFSWVSTGGGSALELMAGKTLPGVEALS